MELVNPGIGLVFWMTVSFAILLWILAKYAWKPIMKALKERESSIDEALNAAKNAKKEMEELKFSNEELLKEAKEERDEILRTARQMKDTIIQEARNKAKEESRKIVDSAKDSIHYEKMAAVTELKNQIGKLSIEIAEKLLREELSGTNKQKELLNKLIDDISFN